MLRIDRRTDSLLFFFFTNIEEILEIMWIINERCYVLIFLENNLNSTGVVQFAIYTMTPKGTPPPFTPSMTYMYLRPPAPLRGLIVPFRRLNAIPRSLCKRKDYMSTQERIYIFGGELPQSCSVLRPVRIVAHTFVVL